MGRATGKNLETPQIGILCIGAVAHRSLLKSACRTPPCWTYCRIPMHYAKWGGFIAHPLSSDTMAKAGKFIRCFGLEAIQIMIGSSSMIFVNAKTAKELLKQNLIARGIPKLRNLGFASPRRLAKGYSSLWLRDRGNQIDLFDFQWDWHGRPAFIINFRDISHPDDLRLVREFPNKATPWDFGLRASMAKGKERWFAPRFTRRLAPLINKETYIVMDSVCDRIGEVASFLEGRPPSGYLRDCVSWNDKRLPSDPPPWTERAPGSKYHLPLFRAGFAGTARGNST